MCLEIAKSGLCQVRPHLPLRGEAGYRKGGRERVLADPEHAPGGGVCLTARTRFCRCVILSLCPMQVYTVASLSDGDSDLSGAMLMCAMKKDRLEGARALCLAPAAGELQIGEMPRCATATAQCADGRERLTPPCGASRRQVVGGLAWDGGVVEPRGHHAAAAQLAEAVGPRDLGGARECVPQRLPAEQGVPEASTRASWPATRFSSSHP